MKSTTKNSATLNLRLPRRQKAIIEKAALSLGQSVSQFAIGALIRGAQTALQEQHTTVLTLRDMERFVEVIESDAEPNEALKRAAQRYKRYKQSCA